MKGCRNPGRLFPAVVFLAQAVSCSREWLAPGSFAPPGAAVPIRSMADPEILAPPLKMAWSLKLTAAPGSAISGVGDVLFVASKDGRVTLVRAADGKSLRTQKIADRMEIACVADPERWITASRWGKRTLQAFRLSDGRAAWREEAGPVESEPLLFSDRLVVGTDDGRAASYDPSAGRRIWQIRLDAPVRGYAGAGNVLLFATERGSLYCLSAESGKPIWRIQLPGNSNADPAIVAGRAFIGTVQGRMLAIGMKQGTLEWNAALEGGIYFPAAADAQAVFAGTSRGIVYSLVPETGTIKWKADGHGVIGTAPVISGDWVYFGTFNRFLVAVDRHTGSEIWKTRLKGRVQTTPLIRGGMLFAGSEENWIYGFK